MVQDYAKARAVTICHDYAELLSSPQQARIIATAPALLKSTRPSAQENSRSYGVYRLPPVHTELRIIALTSHHHATVSKPPAPAEYTKNSPNLQAGWAYHNRLLSIEK